MDIIHANATRRYLRSCSYCGSGFSVGSDARYQATCSDGCKVRAEALAESRRAEARDEEKIRQQMRMKRSHRKAVRIEKARALALTRKKGSRKARLKLKLLEANRNIELLRQQQGRKVNPFHNQFYESREWQEVRYIALRKHGRKCQLCGAVGVMMHVDHIKPRSKHPELALDPANLQVLCAPCNLGKSNKFEDDWRT